MVVTGIVVGLLVSIGVVCLWRLRANRLAWLPLLAVIAIAVAIAAGTECDLDADANAVAKGKTRARLEMLRLGLAEFRAQHGRYPSDSAGLAARSDGPDPFLQKGADLDGWGRAFRYRVIGNPEVQIYSLGPDGIDEEGAGDDMKAELCD